MKEAWNSLNSICGSHTLERWALRKKKKSCKSPRCFFSLVLCKPRDPSYTKKRYWAIWGFPYFRGTLFRGPYNKDYSILGSTLGSPYFGKLPYTYRVHKTHFLLFR